MSERDGSKHLTRIESNTTTNDMGSTLTARISDELAAEITRISKEEHLDKSAVARRLLEDAVARYRVDQAVEGYEQGRLSLRSAAKIADLPLWSFLDELGDRDVALNYDVTELEQDFEALPEDA